MNFRTFLNSLSKTAPDIVNLIMAQRDYDLRQREVGLRKEELGVRKKEVGLKEEELEQMGPYRRALGDAYVGQGKLYNTMAEMNDQEITTNTNFDLKVEELGGLYKQLENAVGNQKLMNNIQKKIRPMERTLLAMKKDFTHSLLTKERQDAIDKLGFLVNSKDIIFSFTTKEGQELMKDLPADASSKEYLDIMLMHGNADLRNAARLTSDMMAEGMRAYQSAIARKDNQEPILPFDDLWAMVLGKHETMELPKHMEYLEKIGYDITWPGKGEGFLWMVKDEGETNEVHYKRVLKFYTGEFTDARRRYINDTSLDIGTDAMMALDSFLGANISGAGLGETMGYRGRQEAGEIPPYEYKPPILVPTGGRFGGLRK